MATTGGQNRESVQCPQCTAQAARISTGLETDSYRCAQCGFQLSITWDEEVSMQDTPTEPARTPWYRRIFGR